jgi:hypothetical protein
MFGRRSKRFARVYEYGCRSEGVRRLDDALDQMERRVWLWNRFLEIGTEIRRRVRALPMVLTDCMRFAPAHGVKRETTKVSGGTWNRLKEIPLRLRDRMRGGARVETARSASRSACASPECLTPQKPSSPSLLTRIRNHELNQLSSIDDVFPAECPHFMYVFGSMRAEPGEVFPTSETPAFVFHSSGTGTGSLSISLKNV